jgi:predicted PurR-regulated permease PerM
MGLYWLTSRDSAVNFLTRLFAPKHQERAIEIITEIENSLGSYMSGIILVALIVGIANFVLLMIFGVTNAATLSFIIGFTTIIPIVGGLIGGALATFLALLTSPLNGLIVFVVFILMQQLENHVLTPRVMSRSVGLDPLLVIVGVFVGFALGGVVGAIVSIPVMGTLAILIRYLILEPYQQNLQSYHVEDGVILFNGEAKPTPQPVEPTVPVQKQ